MTDPVDLEAVRRYRDENGARILRDFAAFLAIPNVASDKNIGKNADHLERELEKRGFQVERWEIDGAPPVVFAELEAADATRTLGLYFHYDGQPVETAKWTHPPWQPTLCTRAVEDGGEARPLPEAGEPIDPEWRLYARSAGDDKAPYATILGAIDALQASAIPLKSNLKIFIEGEEESSSAHLEDYMDRWSERLGADLWLVCDGPVHPSRRPQLVFGVRGFTGLDITVYGPRRHLHSGHYGNWAPNPSLLLAQLLASMKDDDGDVVIEGFYESSTPVSAAERAAIDALPDFDAPLRRELGLAATEGGNAPLAERTLRPSLNIRGLESTPAGEDARNVIPTEASASLDIRLVKGNDPIGMLEIVEEHIRQQGYHIVRDEPGEDVRLAEPRIARVRRNPGYRGARCNMDDPLVRQLIAAARAAAGEDLVLWPAMGASLPLYLFEDVLASPVVIVPIANHDDNQHGPDENLRVANLWYGIELMAAIFTMD